MSHLALQVWSSKWVHKTWIHSIQRWHHFDAKTSQSTFLLEKRLHSLLYWIWYSWSGLTIILYYILSIKWNTLLKNQISSCQQVFYYINMYTDDQKRQYKSTSLKCYNHFCVEVPCQTMIVRNSVNCGQNYSNRNLTAKGFSCSKDNYNKLIGIFLEIPL